VEITAELQSLLDENSNGYIYLQVSRGAHDKRDFTIFKETKSTFFAYYSEQKLFAEQTEGETSIIFPDIRWKLRHVKTTQLMASRLAKKCAAEAGAIEPIFIETTSSNVFIVKGKTISTHPADNDILWGITRSRVMEQAVALGYEVEERKFTLDELLQADEVFRTSTTQGVKAISSIKIVPHDKNIFAAVEDSSIWQPAKTGEYKINNGKIGEVSKTLAATYAKNAKKLKTENEKLTQTA
jgi:D-alanine transaminase